MPKPAFLLPFLFIAHLAISQQQALFRITEKGKTGYINSSGTTVIPPIYHNGFDFAEGLAAVRENELYGFIDSSGKYVLAPQFDYASYFVNGITLVYKQRKSYFIDKTGNVVLPEVYQSIEFIDDRRAIIQTRSQHAGIIDVRTGRLLLDTLYFDIGSFNNGVAVIQNDGPREKGMGVIDTAYHIIVPFGTYEDIFPFKNGYAQVYIDFANGIHGVIDVTGKLVVKINQGDTTLFDTDYKKRADLFCGRTVAYRNEDFIVLDRNGKQIGTQSFRNAAGYFKNYAIVETDKGSGIIDTNTNFIIPPQYDYIFFPDSTADYFFFRITDSSHKYKYGIADLKNHIIIPPIMDNVAHKQFVNGLISTKVGERKCWLNKQGRIVWQESIKDQQALRAMNIDFAGEINEDEHHFPSWDHHPANHEGYTITTSRKIKAADGFKKNEFTLKIETSQADTFLSTPYFANTLTVANSTKDTIKILTAGSLTMRLEALDDDGAWKSIEFFQIPSHTNGYYISFLPPRTCWPFKIPRYEGSFATKIRAILFYEDKNEKVQTIYSNVIDATINRTQFWRTYYFPKGVYDPHLYYPFDMNIMEMEKIREFHCN
jgi:hypothetical protein